MTHAGFGMHRTRPARHHGRGLGHRLTAGVAALVLSLAAGVPLRSAQTLLPDPDDTAAPCLGL